MNIFQTCKDTSDAIELFAPQHLYLKPIARLNISVQLPQIKVPGKTISNWEVMEKLKGMIKPEEFTVLKVSKSTLEFIRFEAEIENKSKLSSVIATLDTRTIKLSGFSELLKIRAAGAKIPFPTRHTWDSYFRDAKNMNEMKPGERPDTMHISNLPCKWFVAKQDKTKGSDTPSEYVFKKVFEVFGEVRCVDIPITDPYRNKMKSQIGMKTFSFDQDHSFEGYVQFREYICFVKAMDALRGMKLLYKDGDKAYTASIKVDFDKTKHLSDVAIQRRRVEREKLIAAEREQEEQKRREKEVEEKRKEEERQRKLEERKQKAERRRKREEKRKLKELMKLKEQEDQEMSLKIAIEERKLLQAQRKLESIRLLDELFERVKIAQLKELERKKEDKKVSKEMEKNEDKERELRNRLVKKYKSVQKEQQEKLQRTIKLRSVLASTSKAKSSALSCSSISSENETNVASATGRHETSRKEKQDLDGEKCHVVSHYKDKHWYPNRQFYENPQNYAYPYDLACHPPRKRYQHRGAFYPRRRGFYFPRWKRYPRQENLHNFHPQRFQDDSLHYYDEYYRYFQKFAKGRDENSSRSRSRSCSRPRSRSCSRPRSRSCSRPQSEDKSRSFSISRSKSSSHSPVRSTSVHKVVKESDSEMRDGERKKSAKHSKKKKKHKKEMKSSDGKRREKRSKKKHEKEH